MAAIESLHLIETLETEIALLQQLIDLLNLEKQALSNRQFESLETLANQKEQVSESLESASKKRIKLLGLDLNLADPKLALDEFLKRCSPEERQQISSLNQTLLEKILICRELNAVNGQVIVNNISTRQDIINALTGKDQSEAAVTYSASGSVSTSKEPNSFQKA
ncbi:flagella synthesis protein FlgN [Legionella jordanis]|uniref:Flagellar biosynthesis/type III secretory pathway chaperone n=1 Tax=Legionella jordanis TaxID=456 RepID=A0A0W0VA21_9GAMM|nr:flagellar protein FlgN [Legionella jordanis]KTD16979.1 flagellar biosynthesis/type III secretory pathway chaperone [Legionella jordanis]RMX03120.1 flagellar protein FlgN [Legionella jordanis]VEH12827.1 flagella synthesis protein FlgN [Legionella jordanis]